MVSLGLQESEWAHVRTDAAGAVHGETVSEHGEHVFGHLEANSPPC
jgi:hypothetical protein